MTLLRRAAAWALLALASFSSSGCYKATFIDPNATAGEEHEQWTDFFIFGLVGSEEIDVRRFCQGPVALVRTGGNFGTGIVTLLTIGIYAPRKIYVTCAAGPGQPAPAAVSIEEREGEPVRVRHSTARGESVALPEEVQPGVWRVRMKKGGTL